jgi:ethylene receptor
VPELVTGDDKRLMQTALNVVGNAVKFTKEGSVSMTVCLERPELERDPNAPEFNPVNTTEYIFIRVQVKDTGRGVDPTTIPKLFNKFAQPDTTGGRSGGGAGLGLAICKRWAAVSFCHGFYSLFLHDGWP